MARNESTGIKQLPNKMWSCRIYKKINGKQIDSTYKIDSRTGKPFAKKSEAIDFRRWKNWRIRRQREINPRMLPLGNCGIFM